MVTTREPFCLDRVRYSEQLSALTYIFYFLFVEASKHDDDSKCWGYVLINTEPLCLELSTEFHKKLYH